MPIPFILAGLGIAAGAIGVGGHLSAKETNERAMNISRDAENLYNNAKVSLENAQKRTESTLLTLGNSKRNVLETSIKQFLQAYNRIKNIKFNESDELYEISNFVIDQQEAIQLQEMTDIYESQFSSGVTGAAAGAVIALAVNGSLPVVTGVLSTAGTAFMAGEIGVAAGLASSALSFGAAMTPLGAIAAPVLLFSGITSSIKADENLEKARTMYADAEAKAEQMRISETLCDAIITKADMFNNLLIQLNTMFSKCAQLLDEVTSNKIRSIKGRNITSNDFTQEELNLIAVTRALAGAVKSVIDISLLEQDGSLSKDAENIYNDTTNKLPNFASKVNEVESYNYNIKKLKSSKVNNNSVKKTTKSVVLDSIRNIFSIIAAFIISSIVYFISNRLLAFSMTFTITTLLFMNNNTNLKFFKTIKNIFVFTLAIEFGILFYVRSQYIISSGFSFIGTIISGVVTFVLFGLAIGDNPKGAGNFRKMLQRIFGSVCFFSVASLIFFILADKIGISYIISFIITEILYMPFAFMCAYVDQVV